MELAMFAVLLFLGAGTWLVYVAAVAMRETRR
jgi:hypothetical protein